MALEDIVKIIAPLPVTSLPRSHDEECVVRQLALSEIMLCGDKKQTKTRNKSGWENN